MFRKLAQKVLATINRYGMLEDGMSVLVAVSGGRDSVSLLRCLRQLAIAPLARMKLEMAHFNHHIRGAESDEDERFVGELSAELGLPLRIGRADVGEQARRVGSNLEEVSRRARYAFLRETASRIKAARIATGHTLSDQAETVLMRLIRGTATEGLAAIHPVMDGLIIRPLIGVTREEITALCHEKGWAFREDSTNSDLGMLRNRIRLDLIPRLRELNPRVERTLGRLAETAALDEKYVDQIVRNLMNDVLISSSRGGMVIALGELHRHPPSIQSRVLREFVRSLRDDGRTLDHQRVMSTLRLIRSARSGTRIDLGQGVEAWREFNQIHLYRARPDKAPQPIPVIRDSPVRFGSFEMTITLARPEAEVTKADRQTVHHLDDTLLSARLSVRGRRPGDAYIPAHHRSKKKVKDLMIASRIPASLRAAWPLLVDAETDRVLCGPRLPVNRQFAASNAAERCALVRWKWLEAPLEGWLKSC